jgi:cytosine/adenosine deaminase-related metal-dependent hydrolase
MNVLIYNGTIITMHKQRILREGAAAIEDKTIADIGRTMISKGNTEQAMKR